MSNSIIRALCDGLFVMYSYVSGRFYISEYSKVSRLYRCGMNGIEAIEAYPDELKVIEMSSIDPDDLPVSMFDSPIVTGVMVTNRCNLACKYCIARNAQSYTHTNRFVHYQEKMFTELALSGVLSVMLSGGEPTLYNGLPGIFDMIADHQYLCLLDTNGTQLTERLVRAIKTNGIVPRISLDAITPLINDECRGSTDIVLAGIHSLIQRGIMPRINTVLSAANYENIDLLAKWIMKLGITKWHIFKLQKAFAPRDLWITDEEFDKKINQLQASYGDELDIICKYGDEKDKFASFIIDTEGNCFSTNNLVPGKSQKVVFGNIERQSLREIWRCCPDEYKRRHYRKYVYSISKG